MEYPMSTNGNELSADFGNNSMNDSLLKNQLRSSVIVNDKLNSFGQGITNSLLQTYAHPIGNQNILSDRPKTTMQIASSQQVTASPNVQKNTI
jgi:hypothetical protein